MTFTAMCLCFLLRTQPDGRHEVLLGHKQRGLGVGNVVGLGGKVEPGEDAQTAAARETLEESGIVVKVEDLRHAGTVIFDFPTKTSWNQSVDVFVADAWSGDPVPCAEIVPEWHSALALPLAEMWDDARYWLPQVLAGARVSARFEYAPDCRTVTHAVVDTRPA
jgi:8-oxo-dGTP diphosphatase